MERGIELLSDLKLEPADVLLIGDTFHDYEVSQELGCDCLLVCNGHQSYEKLSESGAEIVSDIFYINDYLSEVALYGQPCWTDNEL